MPRPSVAGEDRCCAQYANGGEGGIRTPDTLSGMPVFKTGAINHSATSPDLLQFYYSRQVSCDQQKAVSFCFQRDTAAEISCTQVCETFTYGQPVDSKGLEVSLCAVAVF